MASSSFRQLIRSIPLFRIQSNVAVASTVTNSAKLSASLRCYHHLKPICFKAISPANSLPLVSASVNKIQIRCAHKPALTYDYIRERILLVLRLYDKIDPDQLKLDSHFTKDLGLDSLDHVELIMAIEDEFQFEIPDQDAEKLNTPEDILKYISIKEEIYPELEHRDDHGEGHH